MKPFQIDLTKERWSKICEATGSLRFQVRFLAQSSWKAPVWLVFLSARIWAHRSVLTYDSALHDNWRTLVGLAQYCHKDFFNVTKNNQVATKQHNAQLSVIAGLTYFGTWIQGCPGSFHFPTWNFRSFRGRLCWHSRSSTCKIWLHFLAIPGELNRN